MQSVPVTSVVCGLHRQSSFPIYLGSPPPMTRSLENNNTTDDAMTTTTRTTTAATTLNNNKSPCSLQHQNDEDRALFRKELDTRLSAYLPALVRKYLEQQETSQRPKIPDFHQVRVVCMFADVSGFTAMTESLAARGPVGAEYLGKHLNSYFEQLLRLVSSAGGDAFKFAGDAMVVFWAENKEDSLESLLRRCVQCALRIQAHLHQAELAPQVVLSIKMGIGIGGATIAHLGGVSDGSTSRMEYIAVGPALEQAFRSEHQAQAGDVICSPQCWQMVRQYFEGEEVGDGLNAHSTTSSGATTSGSSSSNSSSSCSSSSSTGSNRGFYKVKQVRVTIKLCSRRPSFSRDDEQLHARMKQYVSRAVWPYLNANDEFWGSELRDVTVLFINLGFNEEELARMLDSKGLQRLQDAFAEVQRCIFEYEGTINKFLVDDKGSTVLAAFGLPPVSHENDPIRGILASLAICASLGKYGLKASVGITSGTALCGVVGHQGNRREYTILGDMVNLAARLMQKAKSERGGVITDESTKLFSQDILHFEERPEIMVKGKHDSIKIHRPYPRMSILLEYHLEATSMDNAGGNNHGNGASVQGGSTVAHRSSKRASATATTTGDGIKRATPIANVMENMHRVQVRDAQRRLSLRLEQEVAQRDIIVESADFRRCRAKLLAKCSQLNRFASGGAFILEGDTGVGKTVFLRHTLSQSAVGSSVQVLVATASAFVTRKEYAVWADLITKHALDNLDEEPHAITTRSTTSSDKQESTSADVDSSSMYTGDSSSLRSKEIRQMESRKRRLAAFIRRKIEEGAAPNTTLVSFCGLLNEILELRFDGDHDKLDVPATDATSKRTSRIYGHGGARNTSVYEQSSGGTKLLLCGELELSTEPTNEVTNPVEKEDDEEEQNVLRREKAEEVARLETQAKEEEIATWFLGLLQMDLDANRQESEQDSDPPEHSTVLQIGINQLETSGDVADSPVKEPCPCSEPQQGPEGMDQDGTEDEDEEGRESEWKPKGLDLSGILLLCALYAISREKICVFCLDNAMYMDEKSWILTAIIAKYFTNCMVVLGMRSPSAALMEHTESSSYRKQLKLLKQLPSTVACVLEPLGDEDTNTLIGHMLHDVQTIPRHLIEILRSRSQGNPFFLREIIQEMLQQQVIVLDDTRSVCIMRVQEPWSDKSNALFCFYCHQRFASSKERHRCKSCGYVFCGSCTPKACRKKLPGACGDPVRHCCPCYALSSTRRRSTDRIMLPGPSSSSSATPMVLSSAALPGPATAATTSSSSGAATIRARNRMLSLFVPPSLSSLSPVAPNTKSNSLAVEDRLVLRPPAAVKSVLVAWIDQLSISQRMLLKTASVIGSVFEEEVLRAACPIKEHLHRFGFDLLELQRLGVIRQIETSAESEVLLCRKQSRNQYQARKANSLPVTSNSGGSKPNPHGASTTLRAASAPFKVLYRFAQGFMQEVIRSQLLLSQVDKLTARIDDFREQQQKELRQIFFEKAKGTLTRAFNPLTPPPPPRSSTISTSPSMSASAAPKDPPSTTTTTTTTTITTASTSTRVVTTSESPTTSSSTTTTTSLSAPSPAKPLRRTSARSNKSTTPPKKELLVLYDPALFAEENNHPSKESKRPNDPQKPPRRKTRLASSSQGSSTVCITEMGVTKLSTNEDDQIHPPGPTNQTRTSRFTRERRSSAGETSSSSSSTSHSVTLTCSSSNCCQNCGGCNNPVSPDHLMMPFLKLKSGYVYVKKQSSVFAHFKWKPSGICLWKKRFAVLYNSKLVFQHGTSDEPDAIPTARHHHQRQQPKSQTSQLKSPCESRCSCTPTSTTASYCCENCSGSLLSARRYTSLSLRNAKVSGGDAEMVTLSGSHKVFCLQLEVNEWAKGKTMQHDKRFFMIGLDKQKELEDWIYLLKYAIESLENNST